MNVLKFKHSQVPRQEKELARLKVVQGPDYGAIYVVVGPKVTLGRGEETDLVLTDLKASRLHATLSFSQGSGWSIKDLGSANGILHNGKAAKEAKLVSKDTVTLGETTLEFVSAEVGTVLLSAPPRTMSQVQADQAMLGAQKRKILNQNTQSLFKNKRILLIGGAALAALMLLGGEDTPKKKKAKKGNDTARDLASYLPNVEINRASESLFKDGMREYDHGNYSRARTQFETVLQIAPGHPLATLYLENCNNAIKNEVKAHLERGAKDMQAGKLRLSRGHFLSVLRLLYKDQSNPAFVEAKDQFDKVNKLITGEEEAKPKE